MEFKSIASPLPSKGVDFRSIKKQVVPNQSMSLQEIIERFTRGEPLPIGQEGSFSEGEDDLEKLKTMDLVDKQEYIDKLKSTQKSYEKQEYEKSMAEKARLDNMAVDKIVAARLAAKEAAETAK